jgi:hypothetical protein
MYSLTFVHPKGTSRVTWDLDAEEEGDAYFVNCDGCMANGFTLKASPELLTIHYGASCLLELRFLEERMIYLLRLLDGRRSNVVREFYLEEDALFEEAQYTVQYP